ncbi:MAG: ATP-binding cassette domain-containing protein [Aquabacterium sp.]|jgi:molybdate transport system ATP-binding protein|uniref:molybdenum ABC transporter ATP-binding protein n=1 Tax=Aquabacterium sp. TaxID=1872578 RepID=UPI002A36DD3A|nr:ATP-binding cassette domain-containing protein [Aquabacterium sp.]MDX9843228.1 ATP-binding cassette domain-containing protein [Aquabacterium sp.]
MTMDSVLRAWPWLPTLPDGQLDLPLLGNIVAAGLMAVLALMMWMGQRSQALAPMSRPLAHTLGASRWRSWWTLSMRLPAPRLARHRPASPAARALSVELRLQQPGLDIRAQFRVPPGRVCALVGREPATQSALLQAAAGLIPVKGGRIALGQDTLYDGSARVNLPVHQRRLVWLDAHAHLFAHLSVRGNLRYGLPRGTPPADIPDFDQIVAWLELATLLPRRPAQLTPTQRMRVALGRALLSCPQALLLDNPLGEVPEHEREELLGLLAEVPRRWRIPMVLVSPRMSEVVRLADDVLVLHEGRMASAGPAAQVLSDVSLSTFLEGTDAGSVLEGVVRRHDLNWLLSEVDVGGQRITVPAMLHPVGRRVRLKLRARDLSLHRQPPSDTSSLNCVQGRITQVMLAGEHGTYGAVGIELDQALGLHGDVEQAAPAVWALLTRKAIQQMDWQPGQPCVVGFKAMATTVSAWH